MTSYPEDAFTPEPDSEPPKKKESFLQWWAIVPVIIFVVIAIKFGGPPPDQPQQNEGYRGGYIVGTALGGIVLSLLGAWVTYHVTRKSRLGASLMFALGLAFFSLVLIRNSAKRHILPANDPRAPVAVPARPR
jgi:hypothetical protein